MTKSQLAKALGRDRTRRIPEGDPSLGYLTKLAGLLDLSIGELVGFLRGDLPEDIDVQNLDSFPELESNAIESYRDGKYNATIQYAQQAYAIAATAEERARASNLEAGGYDGLGRYNKALEIAQRALHEPGLSNDLRLQLRSAVAGAYYTLWQLFEARAMAGEIITHFDHAAPTTARQRLAQAHAYYVRGHSYRRLTQLEPEQLQSASLAARHDLEASRRLYMALADEVGTDAYRGVASTCYGGLIEIDVELGDRDPRAAVDELLAGLDEVVDAPQCPAGDRLESFGWWCIFGCNIAQKHLMHHRDFFQVMATFTGKASDIAERTGNWALLERVWTKEYDRRKRLEEFGGIPLSEWPIDSEDVQAILGVVSRFPRFRECGWKILQTGRFISKN
ncbi:MAG: hypothetical protein KC983_09065 [Phycisphaerales bacterium]|nr:hypothetical protein [Phycisphaerales bacterium]